MESSGHGLGQERGLVTGSSFQLQTLVEDPSCFGGVWAGQELDLGVSWRAR